VGVSGDDASLMPEALPARDLRELHHVDVALAPQAGERKHLPHPRLEELNEALLVPADCPRKGL